MRSGITPANGAAVSEREHETTLRSALDAKPLVDAAFVAREVGDLHMSPRDAELHRRVRARRGGQLDADMLRAIVPLESLTDEEAAGLWRRIVIHRARMRSDLGRQVPLMVAALDCLVEEGRCAKPVLVAEEALREVVRDSTHDPLTGVLNRRAFENLLERELGRAFRYRYALSLVMIDFDSFKPFNDRHGHPAGDTLLRRFGALLRDEMRTADWCARYGGDEFAVVAAHTDEAGAYRLAARLAARARRELGGEITLSAGVAEASARDRHGAELIAAADAALYASKRRGGDCTTRASRAELERTSTSPST